MAHIARTEQQIGAILRRQRKQAGLSQADLAGRMHARQGTISRLESGVPAMQLRTLMEALVALKLELVIRPRSASTQAEIEDIF